MKCCELQERNMEEMLTVDIFQKAHTYTQLTHSQRTRLAAVCKNVIATYTSCNKTGTVSKDVFRRFFGLVSFCIMLVSVHYSLRGGGQTKEKRS